MTRRDEGLWFGEGAKVEHNIIGVWLSNKHKKKKTPKNAKNSKRKKPKIQK